MTKRALAVLGILVAGWVITVAAPASAVPVFTDVILTGEADILNTGVLVEANNVGVGPAVTVNSISFGTDESGFTGWSTGTGDFFTDAAFVGTPLDDLLSGLLFQTSFPATLTIGGLTIGESYRLQLIASNDLNSTGETLSITVQGTPHSVSGWQDDTLNTRIEFIADDTSLATSFTSGAVLNAYALHQTAAPEPSAALLVGLGLVGLAGARRRARQ